MFRKGLSNTVTNTVSYKGSHPGVREELEAALRLTKKNPTYTLTNSCMEPYNSAVAKKAVSTTRHPESNAQKPYKP